MSKCSKTGSYKLKGSTPLSYTRMREVIHSNLKSLGLDTSTFGLHSFRAGGATHAANAGVSDRLFKRHGRWKTDSAKDGYVKDDLSARLSVTKKLGL